MDLCERVPSCCWGLMCCYCDSDRGELTERASLAPSGPHSSSFPSEHHAFRATYHPRAEEYICLRSRPLPLFFTITILTLSQLLQSSNCLFFSLSSCWPAWIRDCLCSTPLPLYALLALDSSPNSTRIDSNSRTQPTNKPLSVSFAWGQDYNFETLGNSTLPLS
jgi:hypothetical protein